MSATRSSRIPMAFGLALALCALGACDTESPTEFDIEMAAAVRAAGGVTDLAVASSTDSAVTLRWTQVDDGSGKPASYRVKYAAPPIDWKSALVGCDTPGTQIGATISCTVAGLTPSTSYDLQLMSYRLQGGAWKGAQYSNVATGATAAPPVSDAAAVTDLAVASATDSSFTTRWTQVDDGTGHPARYRVKYAGPPIAWSSASVACDVQGTQIGAEASCTIQGLTAATAYDVQLMSHRVVDGAWQGATYSNVVGDTTATPTSGDAGAVQTLSVTSVTDSSLTTTWTQVDDGTGQPARYRVKYAGPPIAWSSASVGCDVQGTQIGAPASCTIQGLMAETTYDIQLMSHRVVDGAWQGATYSNVATGQTDADATVGVVAQGTAGIWISPAEVAQLPTSGSAWNNLLTEANSSCGLVDLADQDAATNVCVMAKALVYARTGDARYLTDVVAALTQIVAAPAYVGRALALGRELSAYVIAADLIGLRTVDPTLDTAFRAVLRTLRTTYTSGAASDLIDCHERRPNNWGAHCGATRAAIAVYLGDEADLARTAQVFKGYLGDRSSYAGFDYGDDLTWQCDPSRPVGINPVGCTRNGTSLDGVLPDDQRRGGSYTWPAPQENYVWEALQGLLAQAVILDRAGYAVWDWEDRALLRAARWLHDVNGYPATGDDTWQPHILNRYYGTGFPAPVPARAGKNVGWTDWTHR